MGLEIGEISRGDGSVIEDDSLTPLEEFTLVEPYLEQTPLEEFHGDVYSICT